MSTENFNFYLESALQNENFERYTYSMDDSAKKSDGYMSCVTFVTITGVTKTGSEKTLNVVVKWSNASPRLREMIPVREPFEKEVFIYQTLLPEYAKLGQNTVEILPKCYAAQCTNGREFLVLENLKLLGYELLDPSKEMSFEVVKLVLATYGVLHGYSLALRHLNPGVFQRLLENNVNMMSYYCQKTRAEKILFSSYNEALRFLPEAALMNGDRSQISGDEMDHIIVGCFFEELQDAVVLHGDAWCNNFMFLIDKPTGQASRMKLLDFQYSGFGSPIMDLSEFIYACVDTGAFTAVEPLLEIYYRSLSATTLSLGLDIKDIFPIWRLMEHWRKFAKFGLMRSMIIVKLSLCGEDEAPDFNANAGKGREFWENFQFVLKNKAEYERRMTNNFVHFQKNRV